MAYFQSRKTRNCRFSYKARILLEGIEQNRRGYQPKYSEEMTQYVADYYAFSSQYYPHLNIQEAKPRPAGSTWISFHPKSFPTGVELSHQVTSGLVKVFFNGQADSYEQLREKYEGVMPSNAFIGISGKSVTISLDVPKLSPLKTSFRDEQKKVKEALLRLSELEKAVSLK